MKRYIKDVVEDFLWTYNEHEGDLKIAADRLRMKPSTLARSLYRAKKRGFDLEFFDNTRRGLK